jgi:hypothetical protein
MRMPACLTLAAALPVCTAYACVDRGVDGAIRDATRPSVEEGAEERPTFSLLPAVMAVGSDLRPPGCQAVLP